jgi:dTDP-4-dehydrorhamnose reductase
MHPPSRDTSVPVARVLVTGAGGLLGQAIVSTLEGLDVVAHTRSTLDITNARTVARAVASASPGVIVNCAAFNDVDGAEDRVDEALAVNAFAVRHLARAAEDAGATLVHYSTDFVFDGAANVPYTEQTRPSPRGAYACSKLLGEWFALEAPKGFVLRVESLFGAPPRWAGRRGTIDGIVSALEEGREAPVFVDRIVSPAYVVDVAAATRHLVTSAASPGLYHCVNTGHASWFDVAVRAAELLGVVRPKLVPVTMDAVKLRAPRPRFCALSNEKLLQTGFAMRSWDDALRHWLGTRGGRAS